MSAKPHFRFLGVPVRIEPLFWVIAVFLGLNLEDPALILTWVAVVAVSVLVHEFGHALALKAFGQSSSVVLHGFGGLTFSQRRLTRPQSIVVSLAGPFSALALLGIPAFLVRESDLGLDLAIDHFRAGGGLGLWPVVVFAAYVNIWWSLANLLPIRPLDGGNVLTELIGLQRARLVSIAVGVAAAIWAYTHSVEFQMAAFFAGFLAFVNLREYQRTRQGERRPSAFDIDAPEPTGGGGVRPGSASVPSSGGTPTITAVPRNAGWPTGPPAAPSSPIDLDPETATRLAWNLLRDGQTTRAQQIIARATGPVDPFVAATATAATSGDLGPLVEAHLASTSGPANLAAASVADDHGYANALVQRLLAHGSDGIGAAERIQTHLHYAERFAASAAVGELIHPATDSRAQVAFDIACARWSRAGDVDRGMRWIATAVRDGFTAPSLLDGEPDLAPLREHPDWPAVRSEI